MIKALVHRTDSLHSGAL